MILDRTIAPSYKNIEKIHFIKPKKYSLSNHLPVYTLQAGKQEVIRIEWVFEAGNIYNTLPFQSSMTFEMLKQGTKNKNSTQIINELDQYGAFLEVSSDAEQAEICLYCPTKFVHQILAIVAEILTEPIFPDHELEIIKRNYFQGLQVDMQKPASMARKAFLKNIFPQHPYGISYEAKDVEGVNASVLKDFYQRYIYQKPFQLFVTGYFEEEATLSSLNHYFGQFVPQIANYKEMSLLDAGVLPTKIMIEKRDSLQNSLRIGKIVPSRKSPDYLALSIAQTVLGGYFGSRLMQNIREDKGYTYGISSFIRNNKVASYMCIATDVRAEVSEETLTEIYKEIVVLQNEKISDQELQRVKNYMLGNFVSAIANFFTQMDSFRNNLFLNTENYYDDFLQRFHAISAQDVLIAFQTHFKIEDLTEIVAGKTPDTNP